MSMNSHENKLHIRGLTFYISFFVFFLLYFGFTFYEVAIQDMKTNELITSAVVKKNWGDLILNRLKMGHPPLYFFLTKVWMTPFEYHQVYLYAFTILIGSFGIPLMYLLARQMKMGNWSLIAALFWSLHPAVFYYARLIRPQIFVSVLSIAYLLILLRLLWGHSLREVFALLFLGAIGALVSPLFLFFWISILVTSVIVPAIRKLPGKEYWMVLSSILGIQVVISLFVKYYSGDFPARLGSVKSNGFNRVIETLIEALSGVSTKLHNPSFHWVIPIISLASLFWLLCANNRLSSSQRVRWYLLLGNVVISLFLFWGISYTVQPLWIPRYFVFLLPVMILAVVQALLSIPSKKVAAGCVSFILLACVFTSSKVIKKRFNGLRDMVQILEKQYEPKKDGVLVLNSKTKEALSLYANTDFNPLLIHPSFSKEKSFTKLNSYMEGKSRLWVIWYNNKETILNMKEWEPLEDRRFQKMKKGKVFLQGYHFTRI